MSDKVLSVVPETAEGLEVLEEWQAAGEAVKLAHESGTELARSMLPFSDNLPYDRNRMIQEIKFFMAVEIQSKFEVGKRLILLRENEGAKTFSLVLEDHFPGLQTRTAQLYILFARKAATLPKFQAWASGKDNWSKALTMVQALGDEDLQEFEEAGSVLGIPVDELDKMSVRELKGKIKKLEKEKEEGFDRADKKLVQDMNELKTELEILKAREEPGLEEAVSLIKAADRKILDGLRLLRDVPQELIAREKMLRDMLLGTCGMVLRVVENFEVVVSEAGQVDDQR